MTSNKKSAVAMLLAGLVALVSSYPPITKSFIPWYVKLFIGCALLLLGVGKIVFDGKTSKGKNSKWALMAILFVVVAGGAGYYFMTSY